MGGCRRLSLADTGSPLALPGTTFVYQALKSTSVLGGLNAKDMDVGKVLVESGNILLHQSTR